MSGFASHDSVPLGKFLNLSVLPCPLCKTEKMVVLPYLLSVRIKLFNSHSTLRIVYVTK